MLPFVLHDLKVKLESVQVGTPERIEVYPSAIALAGVREKSQVVVTGFYADGSIQDLTRVATYSSTNKDVFDLSESDDTFVEDKEGMPPPPPLAGKGNAVSPPAAKDSSDNRNATAMSDDEEDSSLDSPVGKQQAITAV